MAENIAQRRVRLERERQRAAQRQLGTDARIENWRAESTREQFSLAIGSDLDAFRASLPWGMPVVAVVAIVTFFAGNTSYEPSASDLSSDLRTSALTGLAVGGCVLFAVYLWKAFTGWELRTGYPIRARGSFAGVLGWPIAVIISFAVGLGCLVVITVVAIVIAALLAAYVAAVGGLILCLALTLYGLAGSRNR